MNREIKFRGWFQGTNGQEYWVYGYLVKQSNGNWEITNGDTHWTVDNVGQFTGLLDKNGKDVYEGDIVKRGDELAKIIFNEGMGAWDFELPGFELEPMVLVDGWHAEAHEVVGNIYDNPNLLK